MTKVQSCMTRNCLLVQSTSWVEEGVAVRGVSNSLAFGGILLVVEGEGHVGNTVQAFQVIQRCRSSV